MTWPATSNATSGSPNSLWWFQTDSGGGSKLISTQFDVVVRKAQNRMKALLPVQFTFNADAPCSYAGSALHRSDLMVDGVYGDQSAVGLAVLLCMMGLPDRASRVVAEGKAKMFTAETLRDLILVALHVVLSGASPGLPAGMQPSSISIPPGVVLPRYGQVVRSATADQQWVSSTQPPEVAPSQYPSVSVPGTTTASRGSGSGTTIHDSTGGGSSAPSDATPVPVSKTTSLPTAAKWGIGIAAGAAIAAAVVFATRK